jgi:hypothetical protein
MILLAQAGNVPHNIDLADLGPAQVLTSKFVGNGVLWNAGGGEGDTASIGAAKFEYRWFDGHSLRVPFLQVMPDAQITGSAGSRTEKVCRMARAQRIVRRLTVIEARARSFDS